MCIGVTSRAATLQLRNVCQTRFRCPRDTFAQNEAKQAARLTERKSWGACWVNRPSALRPSSITLVITEQAYLLKAITVHSMVPICHIVTALICQPRRQYHMEMSISCGSSLVHGADVWILLCMAMWRRLGVVSTEQSPLFFLIPIQFATKSYVMMVAAATR